MTSKKIIKFTIKGAEWTFYVLPVSSYVKRFKNDSEAICEVTDKEVFFRKDFLTAEQVRHEIWHIICAQSYTNSANLQADQVEEKNADIFAEEGMYLCYISDMILKELLLKK